MTWIDITPMEKAAAVNLLLRKGYDFDEATDMIKQAARSPAQKEAKALKKANKKYPVEDTRNADRGRTSRDVRKARSNKRGEGADRYTTRNVSNQWDVGSDYTKADVTKFDKKAKAKRKSNTQAEKPRSSYTPEEKAAANTEAAAKAQKAAANTEAAAKVQKAKANTEATAKVQKAKADWDAHAAKTPSKPKTRLGGKALKIAGGTALLGGAAYGIKKYMGIKKEAEEFLDPTLAKATREYTQGVKDHHTLSNKWNDPKTGKSMLGPHVSRKDLLQGVSRKDTSSQTYYGNKFRGKGFGLYFGDSKGTSGPSRAFNLEGIAQGNITQKDAPTIAGYPESTANYLRDKGQKLHEMDIKNNRLKEAMGLENVDHRETRLRELLGLESKPKAKPKAFNASTFSAPDYKPAQHAIVVNVGEDDLSLDAFLGNETPRTMNSSDATRLHAKNKASININDTIKEQLNTPHPKGKLGRRIAMLAAGGTALAGAGYAANRYLRKEAGMFSEDLKLRVGSIRNEPSPNDQLRNMTVKSKSFKTLKGKTSTKADRKPTGYHGGKKSISEMSKEFNDTNEAGKAAHRAKKAEEAKAFDEHMKTVHERADAARASQAKASTSSTKGSTSSTKGSTSSTKGSTSSTKGSTSSTKGSTSSTKGITNTPEGSKLGRKALKLAGGTALLGGAAYGIKKYRDMKKEAGIGTDIALRLGGMGLLAGAATYLHNRAYQPREDSSNQFIEQPDGTWTKDIGGGMFAVSNSRPDHYMGKEAAIIKESPLARSATAVAEYGMGKVVDRAKAKRLEKKTVV